MDTFSFDGKRERSLSWATAEGETSQSPASEWCSIDDPRRATSTTVLRRTYEALELPGTATDYHFVLLATYQVLWSRRGEEPEILSDLERLCLLDIALVEARPAIVKMTGEGESFSLSVPAFGYLVGLYEREGFIEDALAIARRGAALGQGDDDVRRLEERLASLRAEDAS